MAVSKPLLTEFGIHLRLEGCEIHPPSFQVEQSTAEQRQPVVETAGEQRCSQSSG